MPLKNKVKMKKLLNKFRKQKEVPPSSRITSETVAQHREKILAGGRRFKYPIQYARHKLVINAIAISMATLVIIVAIGWWQLYIVQNTSEFFYRITRVVPVPVASVDGEMVLYSDYLMKYRSSVHYLESIERVSLKTDDGKRRVDYIKEQSMQDAVADAYAQKLANELKISISQNEIEEFLLKQRQLADGEISEQTQESVLIDYYGWSSAEYNHAIERKLLRQKVAYAIDDNARSVSESVIKTIGESPTTDLKKLAADFVGSGNETVSYEVSGWVPKTNQDGGLAIEVSKLKQGQVSGLITSSIGNGYYIARLLDSKNSQVSYEYIHVNLTAFTKRLDDAKSNNKVSEFIAITKS